MSHVHVSKYIQTKQEKTITHFGYNYDIAYAWQNNQFTGMRKEMGTQTKELDSSSSPGEFANFGTVRQ